MQVVPSLIVEEDLILLKPLCEWNCWIQPHNFSFHKSRNQMKFAILQSGGASAVGTNNGLLFKRANFLNAKSSLSSASVTVAATARDPLELILSLNQRRMLKFPPGT